MSSELYKYIEDAVEKKTSLFDAEVLEFPKDKEIKVSKNFEFNSKNYWKINDGSNDDQLKAITGICFMFGFLLLMGLFANLNII
tara:strand:- start:263 stop:514 length:252 start_codon:yes stop_codon:yes gene_type:complete